MTVLETGARTADPRFLFREDYMRDNSDLPITDEMMSRYFAAEIHERQLTVDWNDRYKAITPHYPDSVVLEGKMRLEEAISAQNVGDLNLRLRIIEEDISFSSYLLSTQGDVQKIRDEQEKKLAYLIRLRLEVIEQIKLGNTAQSEEVVE